MSKLNCVETKNRIIHKEALNEMIEQIHKYD